MTGKIYKLKAPAKLNIGLRILSKRKDGYHNLNTIFYPVKLYDTITLKISENNFKNNISVLTSPKNSIPEKDNMCTKTINQFLEQFKIKGYFNINIAIHKKIPIGGGLGGGSSDAAAVLKGLFNYFKNDIKIKKPEIKLKKIALSLGSDVPFFLYSKPAFAQSLGEKMILLTGFKLRAKILIIYPRLFISTKWAFNQLKTNKQSKSNRFKSFILNLIKENEKIDFLKVLQAENTGTIFKNDFEEIVFRKYPEVKKIKEMLFRYGAVFASMSGSGSSVYGIFNTDIKEAQRYFMRKMYSVFLA